MNTSIARASRPALDDESFALAAAVGFAVSRLLPRRTADVDPDDADAARYRWFDLIALSAAHGAIALLGWIGLATIGHRRPHSVTPCSSCPHPRWG